MSNIDFLGVGDVVTDAFIRLKDAHIHCKVNKKDCELCMSFGSKVPYESVTVCPAVGNSANACVAAARLGLSSALVSNIGDDYYGKECLEQFKKEGVSTKFIKTHKGAKTNYHYVLWYGDDRTILIKHEEFPYAIPEIGSPKWFYLSSLSEHSLPFHKEILSYLKAHPEIRLAFQPGTFQMKLGLEKLEDLYARTEVFFSNVEELRAILGDFQTELTECMKKLAGYGPKIVVTTDGKNGAYLYDGKDAYFMPPYPDKNPPLERTGAGDAFSSTFVIALALEKNHEEALKWASINSMAVVQEIGAQKGLLTRGEIAVYLESAPTDFKLKKL